MPRPGAALPGIAPFLHEFACGERFEPGCSDAVVSLVDLQPTLPGLAGAIPSVFRRIAETLLSSSVRSERGRREPELEEQLRSLGYVD